MFRKITSGGVERRKVSWGGGVNSNPPGPYLKQVQRKMTFLVGGSTLPLQQLPDWLEL